MSTIHFIDGEKGGVGKSLFARVMVQYCIDKGFPYVLIEADRSNPDVGEIYPDSVEAKTGQKIFHYKQAIFSESERKAYEADQIFELALTNPVIVNLPAQVFGMVNDWIERNGVLTIGSQHGVEICKWFVCTGGYDSVKLFIESVTHFEGKLKHILVRNWGLQDDWSSVSERKELQDLISKYAIKVIDFPKFSYRERDYLDEYRISFGEARELKELGVLGLQRIHNFLKGAYQAIEQAETWGKPAKTSKSSKTSSKASSSGSNAAKSNAANEPATSPQSQ
jgi:hypothetical protein